MEPRLKAEIWIKAHIRKCAFQNIPVFVVHRGDETAGIPLIKINRLNGYSMTLTPITDFETGKRQWLQATGPEWVNDEVSETYIRKQLSNDPDMWVIEIEDAEGRHLLDEKVIS